MPGCPAAISLPFIVIWPGGVSQAPAPKIAKAATAKYADCRAVRHSP